MSGRDRELFRGEVLDKLPARQNAGKFLDQRGTGKERDPFINRRIDERTRLITPQKPGHHGIGVEHHPHEAVPRVARCSAR
jgi:hypothetical protein